MTLPPDTLPRLTGIHEAALRITIRRMEDAGEGEYTGGLREVLTVVRSLASGESVNAGVREVGRLRQTIADLYALAPSSDYSDERMIEAEKILSRWLSGSTVQRPAKYQGTPLDLEARIRESVEAIGHVTRKHPDKRLFAIPALLAELESEVSRLTAEIERLDEELTATYARIRGDSND